MSLNLAANRYKPGRIGARRLSISKVTCFSSRLGAPKRICKEGLKIGNDE
ncbi:hypothetical protein HMPREF0577_0863 [Mobiluncus mulieris ATCC 35243]|nr:hypothetical protein HMPREF0577_0863 [Mobiluncus mulieris ATCC 35243]